MSPRRITIVILTFFSLAGIVVALTGNIVASYIQQNILGNNIWLFWLVIGIFFLFGGVLIWFEVRNNLKIGIDPNHARNIMNPSYESLVSKIEKMTQNWVEEEKLEKKIAIGKNIIVEIEQAIALINKEKAQFIQFKKELFNFIEKQEQIFINEVMKTEDELSKLPKEMITGSALIYLTKIQKTKYVNELKIQLNQLTEIKLTIEC